MNESSNSCLSRDLEGLGNSVVTNETGGSSRLGDFVESAQAQARVTRKLPGS
jgi:hypothetical protein